MGQIIFEHRRKNMQANKSKDSKIELSLRKELWKRGLRYRKNVKNIFGQPDIAFIGKKVAVFCDGEFWHGYDWEHQKESFKSNQEYWIPKIERNMKRDREVTATLQNDGWIVLRFWGKNIEEDLEGCADIIESLVRGRYELPDEQIKNTGMDGKTEIKNKSVEDK